MKYKQILQEIELNLDNQIEGSVEHKINQAIDFLYGGAYDEMFLELSWCVSEQKKAP